MDTGKSKIASSYDPFHIMETGLLGFDWEWLQLPDKVDTLEEWRHVRDQAINYCLAWTDKDRSHNYLEVYWEHTKARGMTVDSVLEIGVKYGHSLCIWNTWFESPDITAVDIVLAENHEVIKQGAAIRQDANGRYQIFTTRPAYLINLPKNITLIEADICEYHGLDEEKYDVIIDDGSHIPEQQLYVLNKFHKNLNSNGVLFIEDIYSPDVVDYLYNNFVGNKENLIRHCELSDHVHKRADGTLDKDSNMLVYINR